MHVRGTSPTRRLMRPLIAAASVAALVLVWIPAASGHGIHTGPLKGFANGQTLHVGALESGGTRLVDTEVAWASANVDASDAGLGTAKLNEVNRTFQKSLSAKHTYARGSGLEIGLGTTPEPPDDANQIIVNQDQAPSESDAPDNSSDMDELLTVDADPLAFASVLRSNTVANWNSSGLVPGACVLTDDLARGQAYAADVELLDTDATMEAPEGLEAAILSLDDENPARAVSQNTTRTRLVPNEGKPNNYGLMSEVRQTIAPITLLAADTPDAEAPRVVTIEILGEWVLRATANGHNNTGAIHYGPGEASPETPLLRVITDEATNILKTQDLFGPDRLPIPLIDIPGLVTVTIGENPRAIAAPGTMPDPDVPPTAAANGTLSSAAVDVVRVKLLSQVDEETGLIDPEAGDIRVGHMEVSAAVPAGGIDCPIPVEKTADPPTIPVGATSLITLTVHNPYDCELTNVVLTDEIRQEEADPKFQLVESDHPTESPTLPTAVDQTEADVVWNLDDIPAGGSETVTLLIKATTGGGIIRDIARASGSLADCKGQAAAGLAVADLVLTGVSPVVEIAIETPRTGAPAAATTATGSILALVATTLGVIVRRRMR